jgi:hypothetical protein
MRLSVRRGTPWNHDLGAGTSRPIISGYHAASHVPAVHKDGRVGAVTSTSRSTMPSYVSSHGDNATSPQTGHTRNQPGHQLLPPGELMDTDSVQPHNDGDTFLDIYQMDDLSLNTNNVPQLALSLCYLALNSICTSLASAYKWNNMARTRKSLRVTDPQGQQRSTYFLQLPYK